MNYYEAKQLEVSKTWHFTCRNGGNIWPVGYCREHGGHDSREEAEECYRQYEIDHANYDSKLAGGSHEPCKECGELTQGMATMRHGPAVMLCDKHRTKEVLDKHVKRPTHIVSSY